MSVSEKAYLIPTMIGSSVAGACARLFMHPIDTCKARLQVQVHKNIARGDINWATNTHVSGGVVQRVINGWNPNVTKV